ncbi:class I SAM-dependent methyltransferase [sulfur-oxidizing endosymbiont of Gigantopelta aegis]|uniref:class I SAM-dependent methyltransferase n=1 Tax=sulfur-oxidizing endosymbiont of Gigantopelta aegis TaxID=2794934 RepID=UPI0018DB92C5|nr:methyltransferase [sulfur-oxidizing endosymbiont of Gigantopelta aegis]
MSPPSKYFQNIEQYRQDLLIQTELCGEAMQFKTTWGLFSPRAIDDGTKLMLQYIQVNEDDDCLDIGCGYGPLGLTLAKLAPNGHTCLIDKDFVAIKYTEKNIQLNKLNNCDTFLSNGLDQVSEKIGRKKFNLIVSNIPAKVGNELLSLFMVDALNHLEPGGRFYVVTITGIRKYIERSFKEVFGNYKKVKQGKTYTVAMTIKE